MRSIIGVAIAAMLAASMHAEPDASRVAAAITSPFITGYTLTRSRAAELGSLGRLWDGYRMTVVRGDIGESIAERAFFGGPELAQSKKGSWVSIAPRYGRQQGIDHVFLRVDKNGLPNNMIIGESKYGNSPRGNTKDGKQMGYLWQTKRLTAIGSRYLRFAKSSDPIIRAKDIPIGAKSMEVYFSKTHKVTIWEKGGKWYTDAEGIADARLRTRATTYGRYFSDAGAGLIRTRNFLFRIKERPTGDYLVKISKLSGERQITSTRTVVVPGEFVAKGRVDTKALMAALKRKHPSWSDRQIAQEAKDIKKVVSNKEFLDSADAHKRAMKEIHRSSIASAGIAGAVSLVFQLGAEAWEHGADFKSYDLEGISMSTVKGAAVAGGASYAGQTTALRLAKNTKVSSRAAGRIGGAVGAAIVLAESFGGCVMGNKSWKDGSIEAGIGAASMVAGHFAASGVSALVGSAAAGSAATAGTVAAGTAAAGTATTVGVGATGTVAATGAAGAGAGASGSGGLMATAAAAGPAIAVAAAAIAAAAAVSYGGYVVYDRYKSIKLVNGEFTFNEKRVDMFFADDERYDRSIDRKLGF